MSEAIRKKFRALIKEKMKDEEDSTVELVIGVVDELLGMVDSLKRIADTIEEEGRWADAKRRQ